MKNKAIVLSVLYIFMVMLLCVSCEKVEDDILTNEKSKYYTVDSSGNSVGDSYVSFIPDHIEEEFLVRDVQIILDADVDFEGYDELSKVYLVPSQECAEHICSDQVKNNSEDVDEADSDYGFIWQGKNGQGVTIIVMHYDLDGRISYSDITRDINGSTEDDHSFEYGYITEDIPYGMEKKATVVEKEVVDFFERFTPFEYIAYNICVVNNSDLNIGYYDISLQAYYNGVPIINKNVGENQLYSSIQLNAKVSSEGMFSFQGYVCFDVKSIEKVEKTDTFENLVNYFINDTPTITTGSEIKVTRIYLSYLAENKYNSNQYTETELIPVICFNYTDSRVENGEEIVAELTAAYSIESGRLFGIYY